MDAGTRTAMASSERAVSAPKSHGGGCACCSGVRKVSPAAG
jgi:hypothetical protein